MCKKKDTNNADAMRLVAELTEARKHQGMSQAELAKRSGISRTMVNLIEHHKSVPRMQTYCWLAEAAGCVVEIGKDGMYMPVKDVDHLTAALTLLRKGLKLTKKELAARTGLPRATVIQIELMHRFPLMETFCELIGAMGYDLRLAEK